MISVRAVEDIRQIQKIIEDVSNLNNVEMGKRRGEEQLVYSVLKHDVYSPESSNNPLNCALKEHDVENPLESSDTNCKKLEMNGWEGDCLTKFIMPDNMVVLENIGIIETTGSDVDVQCWSSDSDITVLRVKKEFRNELSSKVEWEEQRNLGNDTSISSTNLDWDSHSLINLAGVVHKEKDVHECLTPFTIWCKTSDKAKSSMVLTENTNCVVDLPYTSEIKLTIENGRVDLESGMKKSILKKKKVFRNFFRSMFSCVAKKKSF